MGLLCLATSSRPVHLDSQSTVPLCKLSWTAGRVEQRGCLLSPWALAEPQAKPLCHDVVLAYQPPAFPILPTRVPVPNNT